MYAHLYKQSSKVANSKGWILIINDNPKPIGGIHFQIAGKKEARQIAKQHNATAYNF